MSAREQVTWPEAAREAVARALSDNGGDIGFSLHSWRCEYPDHYGPCDCLSETARDVLDALTSHLAEMVAQARRDALTESADALDGLPWAVLDLPDWLRERAEREAEGGDA